MRHLLALLALAALWACESNEPSEPELHNRIVFLSDRDGEPLDYSLYSMAPDGSEVTEIDVGLPLAFVADPVVSPDGRWLAFEYRKDIYVADAAGGQVTDLTRSQTADINPTWSPDGDRIAFSTDRAGSFDIYVVNRDGTGATQLTDDPAGESAPAWSPDGTRIAFTRGADIYVINADGSNPINLTNLPEHGDYQPAWSHDGTRIAFVSDRFSREGTPRILLVMDADGGNLERVGTVVGADQPTWSPDDRQLAFEGPADPPCTISIACPDIYIINVDGTELTNLTQTPEANDESPFWIR